MNTEKIVISHIEEVSSGSLPVSGGNTGGLGLTSKQLKPVSKTLRKIKKRTFGLQISVGVVALSAVVISFYLILAGEKVETKLGVGGFLFTILSACLVATFRLHTCLNSVDATEFFLQVESKEKAEMALNNSPCLKTSGLQEFLKR